LKKWPKNPLLNENVHHINVRRRRNLHPGEEMTILVLFIDITIEKDGATGKEPILRQIASYHRFLK
jgi:hypothetical protein